MRRYTVQKQKGIVWTGGLNPIHRVFLGDIQQTTTKCKFLRVAVRSGEFYFGADNDRHSISHKIWWASPGSNRHLICYEQTALTDLC